MVNPIGLIIGAIGIILVVANVGKIKDLFPTAEAPETTTIVEGGTTIIEAADIPPQDGTKAETERQIIFITGQQVAPPTPLEAIPKVVRGKTEADLAILEDFSERQLARKGIELAIDPRLKFSTSLAESQFLISQQIKRDPTFVGEQITNFQVTDASSTFQQTLKREQERAARLFQQLFGSVQNPEFGA